MSTYTTSRLARYLSASVITLTLIGASGTLGGCTYLGKAKPGVSEKLEFDLRDLGLEPRNTDPMKEPSADAKNDVIAWSNIGTEYEKQGKYDYAVKAFTKCAEMVPGDKFYWHAIAHNEQRLDHFKQSAQAFRKALELDCNDIYTMASLAFMDQQLARDKESRLLYVSALSLKSDFGEAWSGIVNILHRIAEPQFAEQVERLRSNPNEPFNLTMADSLNEYYLTNHPKTDDEYYAYLCNRGYIQMRRFQVKLAEATFKSVMEAKPGTLEAHRAAIGLGTLYQRAGRDEEAIAVLNKLIEESPKQPEAWYNLALINKRNNNLEEAVSKLGKATSYAPDHVGWSNMFQHWLELQRQQRQSQSQSKS